MRQVRHGPVLAVSLCFVAACAPSAPTPSSRPLATPEQSVAPTTVARSTPSPTIRSEAANVPAAAICAELELIRETTLLGDCSLEPIRVGLLASAEAIAQTLRDKYGDRLELSVGLFPYPPPDNPERACIGIRPVVAIHHPLGAVAIVDGPIVGGSHYQGTVRLTNSGAVPFELETSSNFSLYLFRAGEPDPIGLSEGGSVGTGYGKTMAPGESVELEASGGTASCDLALGYVVPAGSYEVRGLVDFKQDLAAPSLFFWSDAATVTIIDP
jgi:hypothetical protein